MCSIEYSRFISDQDADTKDCSNENTNYAKSCNLSVYNTQYNNNNNNNMY